MKRVHINKNSYSQKKKEHTSKVNNNQAKNLQILHWKKDSDNIQMLNRSIKLTYLHHFIKAAIDQSKQFMCYIKRSIAEINKGHSIKKILNIN